MRVLAALAAFHVIRACPDGQCDEVEMLQSSVSQVKDSATFQLSATVHGGKRKSKPETKQSAVSAHSPQPAEEKAAQLAEKKPAEEKSPRSAEEEPAEDAEEESPQSAKEEEIEEKSAQLAEEKPAEEKSPRSAEEEPAEDRPAEDPEESEEDLSPAKRKEIEEKSAHLAEEKPAEEKSPRSAEEEPAEDAEEESPRSAKEEEIEEKSAQLAEEKPAEEKSPRSAEEEPAEDAEEESPQSAKEKEIEEKSAQLAEEKPAEEKSPRSAEEEPAEDAEEESPQSAKEKEIEEKSAQLAEEKPAEEKSPRSAEKEPAEDAEEESPQSAKEKEIEEKSAQLAEEKPAEKEPAEDGFDLFPEDKPAEEKSPRSAEEKPAGEKSPQSAEEKEIQKKVDWNKMMEIALLLARARDTCKDFAAGPERCLPLLKDYRRHAWPFIEKELGKNLTFFKVKGPQGMKNGWRPFFLKTRLRGCVEHPVIYMQVMGVKAKNLVTNLRKHSTRPSAIKTGHIDKAEICRATKNKKAVGVTFVRDPLERFIESYEELVAFRRNRPNWAKRHAAFLEEEKSSTEHARLFIETFLQGRGKDITATILPQVEYFLETANNCSATMSFVGKSESPADEWQRMIHDMGCDPAKIPYLNATATHPLRSPGKHPLRRPGKHPLRSPGKNGIKAKKTSSLLEASSGAPSSIAEVMKQNNSAYLRAWCWFSMPDYVLLKYDLPAECQDLLDGFVV